VNFKIVWLWTDLSLWLLFAALLGYAWHVRKQPALRANWDKVLRDPAALCAGIVLVVFLGVTALDSLHFRRVLAAAPGQAAGQVFYGTQTESLLDVVLARPLAMRESSYSQPLATHALLKQNIERDGKSVREVPRLAHGGAHLADPATEWRGDVITRAVTGAGFGLLAALGVALAAAWSLGRHHSGTGGGIASGWQAIAHNRTQYPVRAALLTLACVLLLLGPVVALAGHYHVLGTDRTGNDVMVQALKSVRTAFVIGSLATLATLPLALLLGVLAGYFGGWVDELVQYLYTTLTAVPNVLLIAACVLMVQVFLDTHPNLFETGVERADLKMFLLCVILGLTGWATLCRLVRAETFKLRELEYVQAAQAFGVAPLRIMLRHIVPNVMHLVLITTVLSFSDLILYEAVLTYVGVGVDPGMSSFGGMINLARNEMSADPLVWWSFAGAFGFMVVLVLAANLFADGVQMAFDPRARALRPRLTPKRPATAL
jgi:peptide/nickel transport system permease protein